MSDPKDNLNRASLTIGQLASRADVNVETIRYYQRIGLIETPRKPAQGYRRYSAATANRIRFIKRAQNLGFSLDEIGELLSLSNGHCDAARMIAEHKLADIQRRISDLAAMQEALARLVKTCRNNANGQSHCAIIETLNRPDQETLRGGKR